MLRLLVGLFICVALLLPQTVLAKSKIDKARDYAKIEKISEARQLLDEAILADPLDADVHYRAGLVYGQLGDIRNFNLAMKNACKLKSSYCPKVAEPYYSQGYSQLQRGSQSSAVRAFQQAFQYNPRKKQATIQNLFDTGIDLLKANNISSANLYLGTLHQLDNGYGERIAAAYSEKSSDPGLSAKTAVFLLEKTVSFSGAYKGKIGHTFAKMAKDNNRSQKDRGLFKKKADRYLTDKEFLAYFPPDYKIYQPRKEPYIFNLKAGETTDHWIMFPVGTPHKYNASSAENKFELIFDDGDIVPSWTPGSWPSKTRIKFKIHAVTDQQVKLFVRP